MNAVRTNVFLLVLLVITALGCIPTVVAQSAPPQRDERGGFFDFLFRGQSAPAPAAPAPGLSEARDTEPGVPGGPENKLSETGRPVSALPKIGPTAPRRPTKLEAPSEPVSTARVPDPVPSPAAKTPPLRAERAAPQAAPIPPARNQPATPGEPGGTVVMMVRPDLNNEKDFRGRRLALGISDIDARLGERIQADWGAIVVDPQEPGTSRIAALSKALVDERIDGVVLAIEPEGALATPLPVAPDTVLRLPIR